MPDATDLIDANAAFYRAFAERDIAAMAELWASRAPVWCTHPGWRPLVGREDVLASWRDILGNDSAPSIRFRAPEAVLYDAAGVVLCEEAIGELRLAAANGFVVEDGRWRMVHHQASLIAPAPGPEDASTGSALH